MRHYFVCLLILSLTIFVGCSNSSSSSGESDSGVIVIRVSPGTISLDNLAFIDIDLLGISFDDLESEGVTLKIIISEELEFVDGSAVLVLSNGARAIEPIFVGTVPDPDEVLGQRSSARSEMIYIIFAIEGEALEDVRTAAVQFEAEAVGPQLSAQIYADLDRGAISEFDPDNADFDSESDIEVELSE